MSGQCWACDGRGFARVRFNREGYQWVPCPICVGGQTEIRYENCYCVDDRRCTITYFYDAACGQVMVRHGDNPEAVRPHWGRSERVPRDFLDWLRACHEYEDARAVMR